MNDRCVMCGKFLTSNCPHEHCDKCIETLNAEINEIETGIGTGGCISGKFGTTEYCRHEVKRSTNVPKGRLRLLT